MRPRCRSGLWSVLVPALASLLLATCTPAAQPASPRAPAQPAADGPAPAAANPATAADPLAAAMTMPLEELYARARQEGGTLVLYSSLAQANAEKLLPAFEQRFPGVTVDHAGGPADRLVARVISEARGGRVLADVFSSNVEYVHQLNQQGLVYQGIPPEAMTFPEDLRGNYWVANDLVFIVPAWNTNLVSADEAPRQFEDLAHPRWRNRLIADPRDFELFMGLALRKYRSEEQAARVLREIAANNPEFHNGHVELAELLVAGHAAACLTCYAHHFPARMRRRAPVDYLPTEGIGLVNGSVVLKNAPHPYTAALWQRWVHSEEGQQAYAESGRTPALPGVQVRDDVTPEKVYALGPDEVAQANKYQQAWREIFNVR